MHRRETISTVPGVAGRKAPIGRRTPGAERGVGHHEKRDEKVRQAADEVD